MKKLLTIISVFAFLISSAQTDNNCQILRSILEYQPAKKPYYFDKNISYPIIFHDTMGNFKECVIGEYYNRQVKVSHSLSSKELLTPADYIISLEFRTRRIFKIILNYKNSGAYCSFIIKRKNGKFRVTEFKEQYL